MKKNLKLPKTLRIDACESVLNDLAGEGVSDIEFPVETSGLAFAGLSSAVQASVTWARRSSTKIIHLRNSKASIDKQVEEVVSRPHKFVGAMFAKKIIAENSKEEVRDRVNSAAREAIEEQQKSIVGQKRGGLCWFAFVDHSSKAFDPNFYLVNKNTKPMPRRREQIKVVVSEMIETSSRVIGGAKLPSDESIDHLGRIIHELFLNTHEHGARGVNRTHWLESGVRIIYTYGVNLDAKDAKDYAEYSDVVKAFVGRSVGRARFIEISVIDSGLGYFRRWCSDRELSNDVDIEGEYEVFKKCFSFRQSSSGELEKGNGLPVVMDRMTSLKGFMRVRSGRLSLYRDFVENPYKDGDQCLFNDWETMQPGVRGARPHPVAEGVAITLLIPLEAKQ